MLIVGRGSVCPSALRGRFETIRNDLYSLLERNASCRHSVSFRAIQIAAASLLSATGVSGKTFTIVSTCMARNGTVAVRSAWLCMTAFDNGVSSAISKPSYSRRSAVSEDRWISTTLFGYFPLTVVANGRQPLPGTSTLMFVYGDGFPFSNSCAQIRHCFSLFTHPAIR